MPTQAQIISANKKALSDFTLKNPVGVFVGGTSGIGEHTAYAFARYTKSPTIYIVGRNEARGKAVVDALRKINPSPAAKYHFLKHDLLLIREADKLSDIIKQNEPKINLLVLSTGYLTMSGRDETTEGIDKKLAINYYSRWRIIDNLLPQVSAASQAKEPARIISVCAPTAGDNVDFDDLALKKNYTLSRANHHLVSFNSFAVDRFSRVYPNLSFTHAHPGIVDTNIISQLPWYIKYPGKVLMKFGDSPETIGERLFYHGYVDPKAETGCHLINAKLDPIATKKGFLDPEKEETVWDHTLQAFKDAVGTK